MQKTDESIRRICIASIKRHTFKPINYPLTSMFESEKLSDIDSTIAVCFDHVDNELPIVMAYIDNDNWTVLTTRKIVSKIKGHIKQASANSITGWKWNDFKGFKDKPVTFGYLKLNDNTTLDIVIETGNASMMIIYGVMTLTGQETSTEQQIEKTISRYEKRGFFRPD